MDVGVGDRDGAADDVDHQHVRVGGADIVLQHQLVAHPRRGGGQAGMIEFERRRAVEAFHESGDQHAVGVAYAIGTAAVDGFAGEARLQDVQRLVHVHHQQMQAIGAGTVARSQRQDRLGRQLVAVRIGWRKRLEALRERGAPRRFGCS